MLLPPSETGSTTIHQPLADGIMTLSKDQMLTLPVALPGVGIPEKSGIFGDSADGLVSMMPAAGDDDSYSEDIAGDKVMLTVRSGDTLDGLFGRNKLSRADLMNILKIPEASSALRNIMPGDQIEVVHTNGTLQSLRRRVNETTTIELLRHGDAFDLQTIAHPTERRMAYRHGEIDNSLFEAGKQANVSDKVIMNLAGIFAWDVDFVLDIRAGDRFIVIYEQLWQDGELLRDADILAAEFINNGDSYRALRYTDEKGRSDYFTPDGHSVRKAFIRAPVDFSRVSSSFNPRRKHPILKVVRPHRGVDYSAPIGTPIKAAGDGRVIHRGRKGGYGNAVILQHGGNITTLYAHMSRFAKNVRYGSRVRQGQVIGYVGNTGLVTAAHLHYEYRLNGVHRNPRTVSLPKVEPIAADQRELFFQQTGGLLAQLDTVKRSQVAITATR